MGLLLDTVVTLIFRRLETKFLTRRLTVTWMQVRKLVVYTQAMNRKVRELALLTQLSSETIEQGMFFHVMDGQLADIKTEV